MSEKMSEEMKVVKVDWKKKYEELRRRYDGLLATIDDGGFQLQLLAKQNRLPPENESS